MGGGRVKAVSKRALTIMPGVLQGFFQKTYLPAQREI